MDAKTLNSVYPISKVDVYPGGTVIVKRECLLQAKPGGRKQGIAKFSRSSLYRVLFLVSETEVRFKSMLTLTYPKEYPMSGRECKKHLNKLLVWMRTKMTFEYLWFMEFQVRGAPHFHVLLDFQVQDDLKAELASKWAKYVAHKQDESVYHKVFRVHNHKSAWQNIRNPDGARRYVAKYAAKAKQKTPGDIEDVGRFWGASREVKNSIGEPYTRPVTEDELRGQLHTDEHPAHAWGVIPKYVFPRTSAKNYL